METVGWILVSAAAALIVIAGLYGLVPLVAALNPTSAPGRLRIKIDRGIESPQAGANEAPGTADHPSQTVYPALGTVDSRSIDELFSEIFALRESIVEMSAQISALRSSLAGEQLPHRARLKGPSMQQTA